MTTSRFDRKLPCVLTEQELAIKRDEIARKVHEYKLAEAEKRAVTATLASRVKALRADIERLGEEISERTEERLVPCQEESVYEASRVDLIRTDTGEVVGSRPMTGEERQESIFDDRGPN